MPQIPDGRTLFRYGDSTTALHSFLNKPDVRKGNRSLFMEVHLVDKVEEVPERQRRGCPDVLSLTGMICAVRFGTYGSWRVHREQVNRQVTLHLPLSPALAANNHMQVNQKQTPPSTASTPPQTLPGSQAPTSSI